MSALADIVVDIRADVRFGASRSETIRLRVTARADEPAEDVRNTVTTALRQVNDEVKGLIR